MNLEQYVKSATRTESIVGEIKPNNIQQCVQALNIFVAAATLLDLFKKNIFYNKPIDLKKWDHAVLLLNQSLQDLQHNNNVHDERSLNTFKEINSRIFHGVVGIATEAGEMIEAIIKQVNTDHLDNINLAEEIGDVCWYQAILIDALKISWDTILERNIEKLKARYPEKYTDERANNRNIDIERKILEGKK